MRRAIVSALLLTIACATSKPTGSADTSEADIKAAELAAAETAALKPMLIAANRGWFDASLSGSDEAFAKSRASEDAVNAYLADPTRFAAVGALRQSELSDPLVRRQIEVLHLMMLGKQVEPALLGKITALEKEVEQAFNTYRGALGTKKVSQNDIEKILAESTDGKELQEAWEAQKGVGAMVEPKLKELAALRNQVAKALGYRDYFALRLAESELDETELMALFDQLDVLTREPFLKAKAEVDRRLAKRLGIKVAALMPWHYQNPFFQEPPDVFDTGLEALYGKQDTVAISKTFYDGVQLETEAIIAASDLFEKQGKTPHAFASDIDREGDIRVICNIVPGLRWTQTTVHELGHAVYDLYIDRELPWLLRKASHAITTEGLAMMLDRPVAHPAWARALNLIDDAAAKAATPEAEAQLAFAPLQFSRWTQVMLRFERELYRDPNQDLNTLWWDLKEKYQAMKRPAGRNAPDYAAKIHLVIVPVYYHNYMMGDLFGAQVHEAIAREVGQTPKQLVYVGEPKVGKFLIDKVFAPGARLRWDELTEFATGKPLTADAFARRFTD